MRGVLRQGSVALAPRPEGIKRPVGASPACVRCNVATSPGDAFCASCGQPLRDSTPGLVDGRYELDGEIGRGAMGVVYRARDVDLDRPVAVKLIMQSLTRAPGVLVQFRREARALAQVRSDHVVRVYASGLHRGAPFFAMELVAGDTLADLIDRHDEKDEFVPLEQALLLLRQMAAGLDAVHATELVHRDVKPDNVILEHGTGRPVLIDFGLALRTAQSGEMLVAGTPSYMAPEQLTGQRPTAASDAYSLACTAFELLTNRTPFQAPSTVETFRLHTTAPPPPLSRWRPDLTPADPVFMRALAKAPAERYPTCGAMVEALTSALSAPWWTTTAAEPVKTDERSLVLVADDDPAFAKLCARALGIALFGLPAKVVVTSRAELVARARERLPRLVLVGGGGALETHHMLGEILALPGEQPRIAAIQDVNRPVSRVESIRVAEVVQRTADFPELLRTLQGIVLRSGFERAAAPPRSRR